MPNPGWYDDGTGHQRWWDGTVWTEHVQPQMAPSPVAPAGAPARKGVSPLAVLGIVSGVVVLSLVAVSVVAQIVFQNVGRVVVADAAESDVASSSSSVTPPADARAAVELYSAAWDDVDCAELQAAVSDGYFDDVFATCSSFIGSAQDFLAQSTGKYVTTIDSVTPGSAETTVDTTETYSEQGRDYTEQWEYTLITEDGVWQIDDIEPIGDDSAGGSIRS